MDGVTVFLNDPTVLSPDACANSPDSAASAIEAVHDVCTPGAPMINDGASGVVTSVCAAAADPYCCSAAWDGICVQEACASSHPVYTTGAALTNGRSPVVTSVCTVDPYCCNTEWDAICVQEASACSHSEGIAGLALTNGCSPVVTSVCTADPYCCNTYWDPKCVQEAQTGVNSQVCGCNDPVCTTGPALINGCSPVVKSVCAKDPHCCSTAWDVTCVQEVQTVANSQECIPT